MTKKTHKKVLSAKEIEDLQERIIAVSKENPNFMADYFDDDVRRIEYNRMPWRPDFEWEDLKK